MREAPGDAADQGGGGVRACAFAQVRVTHRRKADPCQSCGKGACTGGERLPATKQLESGRRAYFCLGAGPPTYDACCLGFQLLTEKAEQRFFLEHDRRKKLFYSKKKKE